MSVAVSRTPKLEYPAGQRQTFTIDVKLPTGRTLADFSAFTLTVREDPLYPRAATLLDAADPAGQAWATVSVSPTIAIDTTDPADTLNVSFTVPTNAGERRYAFDVWGQLTVGGGYIELYPCTWLSVVVRAR